MALIKTYSSKGMYPNYWKITERHSFEIENRTSVVLELYMGPGTRNMDANNKFGINKCINIPGCDHSIEECYNIIKTTDLYFLDSVDMLDTPVSPQHPISILISNDPADNTLTREIQVIDFWDGKDFNTFILNLKCVYYRNNISVNEKVFTFVISNEFLVDGVGEYKYFTDILKTGAPIDQVIIGGISSNVEKINNKLAVI